MIVKFEKGRRRKIYMDCVNKDTLIKRVGRKSTAPSVEWKEEREEPTPHSGIRAGINESNFLRSRASLLYKSLKLVCTVRNYCSVLFYV